METVLIDGSTLEGGGQMLRTSLGLSAVTGKPFRMANIRKGRCNPGLKEQHLQAVKAMAELCGADVKGAEPESEEIEFYPKDIRKNDLKVSIGTAGSVGLVLQALLIPSIRTDLSININGGATFGKWAVPVEHLKMVLLPLLGRMGYKADIKVEREGFYPRGGAIAHVHSGKAELRKVDLVDKGEIKSIKGISVASENLKKADVAERQAGSARKILEGRFKIKPEIEAKYSGSICPGTAIQIAIETENSVMGGNALGEIGKKAEAVGREAADSVIKEFENGTVDSRTADQLLPYFALAKGGSLRTSRITNHIRTNVFVIEKFLPVKFSIDESLKEVKVL